MHFQEWLIERGADKGHLFACEPLRSTVFTLLRTYLPYVVALSRSLSEAPSAAPMVRHAGSQVAGWVKVKCPLHQITTPDAKSQCMLLSIALSFTVCPCLVRIGVQSVRQGKPGLLISTMAFHACLWYFPEGPAIRDPHSTRSNYSNATGSCTNNVREEGG